MPNSMSPAVYATAAFLPASQNSTSLTVLDPGEQPSGIAVAWKQLLPNISVSTVKSLRNNTYIASSIKMTTEEITLEKLKNPFTPSKAYSAQDKYLTLINVILLARINTSNEKFLQSIRNLFGITPSLTIAQVFSAEKLLTFAVSQMIKMRESWMAFGLALVSTNNNSEDASKQLLGTLTIIRTSILAATETTAQVINMVRFMDDMQPTVNGIYTLNRYQQSFGNFRNWAAVTSNSIIAAMGVFAIGIATVQLAVAYASTTEDRDQSIKEAYMAFGVGIGTALSYGFKALASFGKISVQATTVAQLLVSAGLNSVKNDINILFKNTSIELIRIQAGFITSPNQELIKKGLHLLFSEMSSALRDTKSLIRLESISQMIDTAITRSGLKTLLQDSDVGLIRTTAIRSLLKLAMPDRSTDVLINNAASAIRTQISKLDIAAQLSDTADELAKTAAQTLVNSYFNPFINSTAASLADEVSDVITKTATGDMRNAGGLIAENKSRWSGAAINTLAIAGALIGLASAAVAVASLSAVIESSTATSAQKDAAKAEIVLQVVGGVVQAALGAYVAIQGMRTALAALSVTGVVGIAVGAALLVAVSPLQIMALHAQREFSEELRNAANQANSYGINSYGMLANYYKKKSDTEISITALTTTLSVVGTGVALGLMASGIGAPVGFLVGVLFAAVTLILQYWIAPELMKGYVSNLVNEINLNGGTKSYSNKTLNSSYNQFISTDEFKSSLKSQQVGYGVERVVGITTIGLNAATIESLGYLDSVMAMNSQKIYANEFRDGIEINRTNLPGDVNKNYDNLPSAARIDYTTSKYDPATSVILISDTRAKSQLISFLTPLSSPSPTYRAEANTAANSGSYTSYLTIREIKTNWRIFDSIGDIDSIIDVSNISTRLLDFYDSTKFQRITLEIDAGRGDDTVIAGPGSMKYNGAEGNNTVNYNIFKNSQTSIAVTLAEGGDYGVVIKSLYLEKFSIEYDNFKSTTNGKNTVNINYRDFKEIEITDTVQDLLANVQNVTGTIGADRITGNSMANIISGGEGSDILDGKDGDDYFSQVGKIQNDIIYGGNGSDTLDYSGIDKEAVGIMVNLNDNYIYRMDPLKRSYGDYSPNINRIHDYFNSIENIIGTNYSDYIQGSDLDNIISGGLGSDILIGEKGRDIFNQSGPLNNDSIWGGEGTDIINYNGHISSNSLGIIADLRGNYVYQLDNQRYRFEQYTNLNDLLHDYINSIEGIAGSSYSDVLIGTADSNYIKGNGGSDYLYGLNGNDYFVQQGLIQNDTINGGDGSDTVDYSLFEDNHGIDVNLAMVDNYYGSYVYLYSGRPLTLSERLFHTQYITDHQNTSYINNFIDQKFHDRLESIENIIGTLYADYIAGDENTNIITGGAEPVRDTLFGEGGDDVFLQTGRGINGDFIDGGNGSDTVDYSGAMFSYGIRVELNSIDGINDSPTAVHENNINLGKFTPGDILYSIENIIGSSQNDYIKGNDIKNYLKGGAGNDEIYGGAGDDTLEDFLGDNKLYGEAGDDRISTTVNVTGLIDGGSGTDTIDYSGTLMTSVSNDFRFIFNIADEELGNGIYGFTSIKNTNISAVIQQQLLSIENIISTNYADLIYGNHKNNQIYGQDGDDVIYADSGNDILCGGLGKDVLYGGQGSDYFLQSIDGAGDQIYGGSGVNAVLYNQDSNDPLEDSRREKNPPIYGYEFESKKYRKSIAANGIYANLNSQIVYKNIADYSESVDSLSDISDVVGSRFSDVIEGNELVNTIAGENGDDYIIGKGSDDQLAGGAGNDVIDGGDGDDKLYGEEGDDLLLGAAGNDIIVGSIGSDIISGGDGDDNIFELIENGSSNTVDGGEGSDRLDLRNSSDGLKGRYVFLLNRSSQATNFFNQELFIIAGGKSFTGTAQSGSNWLQIDLYSSTYIESIAMHFAGNDNFDIYVGDNSFIDDSGLIEANVSIFSGQSDHSYNIYRQRNLTKDLKLFGGGVDINLEKNSLVKKAFISSDTAITGDAIYSIENVVGTLFGDQIIGNDDVNYIGGIDGNDVLYGRGGNDILGGGNGSDAIYGENGNDIFLQYSEFDSNNNDLLDGGEGIDLVDYSNASSEIKGQYITLISSSNNILLSDYIRSFSFGDVSGNPIFNFAYDPIRNRLTNSFATAANFNNLSINFSKPLPDNDLNLSYISVYISEVNLDGLDVDQIRSLSNISVTTLDSFNKIFTFTPGINANLEKNTVVKAGGFSGYDVLKNIEGISGSPFDDKIIGNSADNMLYGNVGNDIIVGEDGNDMLSGGVGQDQMSGGAGNDRFFQDLEAMMGDFIDGGQGNDTVDYGTTDLTQLIPIGRSTDAGIVAHLKDGTVLFKGIDDNSPSDTLVSIENLGGTNNNDKVIGSDFDNILYTAAGNDYIEGLDGNDVLDGGSGNDILVGGAGNDTFIDLFGSDWMIGGDGSDNFMMYMSPAAGDWINGDDGIDTLDYSRGMLFGRYLMVRLSDRSQQTIPQLYITVKRDDELLIIDSSDTIFKDFIQFDSQKQWIQFDLGQTGSDNPFAIQSVSIRTAYTADSLQIFLGNDDLSLLTTRQILTDGNVSAGIIGNLDFQVDGIVANLEAGVVSKKYRGFTGKNDTIAGIENIKATPYNDILIGYSANSNGLAGMEGNDTITGGNKSDYLNGGEGDDTIYGLDGNDHFAGGLGSDIMIGDGGDDVFTQEINLQQKDIITGGSGVDGIDYSAGMLFGKYIMIRVDDSYMGTLPTTQITVTSNGNAYLLSNKQIIVDENGKFIQLDTSELFDNAEPIDSIKLKFDSVPVGFRVYIGTTDLSKLPLNHLTKDMSVTVSDLFLGRTEVALTAEGIHANLLYGQVDKKYSGFNTRSVADRLYGVENLTGTRFNDVLVGSFDANVLKGGDGNDVLKGLIGNDVLAGGSGNDTYQFGRGDGIDTIDQTGATSFDNDTLEFASGISRQQLWFARADDNLRVNVMGTGDSVIVKDWFAPSYAGGLKNIVVADGRSTLLSSNVNQLVSAMAAGGYSTWAMQYYPSYASYVQTQLAPAVNALWS